MVDLKNVSFIYENGTEGISNITLHFDSGEFCFLVGKSGSGKSTLSKLITGEEIATSGVVKVNGYTMNCLRGKSMSDARRTIGMVFQDFRLISSMTVWENLEFTMECIGADSSYIPKRIGDVLDIVGLSGKEDSYPSELSGGEKQRVAIARAIINHPMVIIADEPTGNLDPSLSEDIMKLFIKINEEENVTTIVITHAKDLVEKFNRRVVRIEKGRVLSDSCVDTPHG